MKPWWQRKVVTLNDVLQLAFILAVVSVFLLYLLWASVGRANCVSDVCQSIKQGCWSKP